MTSAGVLATAPAESEYRTDERCLILELLNTPDDPDVSVARARVEAGVTTKRHCVIGTEERYVILQGAGRMLIDEAPARNVGPGDTLRIPACAGQAIVNTGASDLVFLCVCTPRFDWRNYRSLE
ncbi:MAG: cupin domain-containing protein [Gammaproteobacteria bacterium]